MSENILDKYSKRILNGAINGTSISAQKIQQNIESISQIDSDFKNTINGLKKEKSKQIEIMFENVLIPELKKRNIAFYGGKVKVEKINYKLLLKYFPIELMAPQKGRFVVEKLIEKLIEKTSKKELSTAEKDDAVNFVYILCLCIQLHILGMGYYWITYNCPIHKETLHFIDYDATFEFGKPDEMLIGYDGYVWKNRKDFCVPSGIPGQHDFCCKCDIIPSYSNSSIEDWERKKREHQKKIEEKERESNIDTFRRKYLTNTRYLFSSEEEYLYFSEKIFDNAFTNYPLESIITHFYRIKVLYDKNELDKMNECIKKMLLIELPQAHKAKYYSDVLDIFSNNTSLFERYKLLFENCGKKK